MRRCAGSITTPGTTASATSFGRETSCATAMTASPRVRRGRLNVFLKEEVTNAVCVVTRYFGGILLGAGGLTRAYGGTAKLALDAAGVSRMRLWASLAVPCPYPLYERMRLLVEKCGGVVENADFGTDVLLTALLPAEDVDDFQEKVTELSAGTVEILVEEERFQPGPP